MISLFFLIGETWHREAIKKGTMKEGGRGHATDRHPDGGRQNSVATDDKAGQRSLRSVVPEEEDDDLTITFFGSIL
ncbi:unnamed protein product [Nezara viridula]|uniref:Uncharacterized protein n=1 Tax=Nezara viridula TaxID=85310 RepID=A0A9P0GXB8_NEZVI|nr:unnamed protein product [Nezara viridula]